MDEAMEQKELESLKQIDQLCQSGDPQALGQIKQIVDAMIAEQEKEMSGGEKVDNQPDGKSASREAMVNAVKSQMGEGA